MGVMLTDTAILDLGLLPFRVRLEQIFDTSPVCVRWEVPIYYSAQSTLPALIVSRLVTFGSWS